MKEIVALENGAVVGKKEEKQARDEEAQLVFFVNAFFFERVVQPADGRRRLNIGFFLNLADFGFDAEHEVENAARDVFGQCFQRELPLVFHAFFRYAAIKVEMGKIADGVIFGQRRGLGAPDFLQITLRLLFGLGQVFVGGFVFGKEDAFPKYIDELGVVGRVFDGVFEVGDVFAVDAENGEKFVLEGVFLAAFVGLVFVVGGEVLCGGLELEQGFHRLGFL